MKADLEKNTFSFTTHNYSNPDSNETNSGDITFAVSFICGLFIFDFFLLPVFTKCYPCTMCRNNDYSVSAAHTTLAGRNEQIFCTSMTISMKLLCLFSDSLLFLRQYHTNF